MAAIQVSFRVIATTTADELVFVCGDAKELGSWNHEDAILLTKDIYDGEKLMGAVEGPNLWTTTISLLANSDVSYRYLIGSQHVLPNGTSVRLIRLFETHLQARTFRTPETNGKVHDVSSIPDTFGMIDDKVQVQRGWLTHESEIHLRFLSNAIYWWKARHRTKTHSMKIVPMDLRYRENANEEDEDELSSPHAHDMEVAVLNQKKCQFAPQQKYGQMFSAEDNIVLCRMRVLEPNFMAYRCDFYAWESPPDVSADVDGAEPRYVGCCYILPPSAKDTYGDRTVLINGQKHQPIGQLFVHFMQIQPCADIKCSLEISYAKYWRKRQKAYDIGHRGSGNSFSVKTQCANIRENTIASLATAARNGADFVEFDVQLSKDKIPVIYHDFTCFLTMRRRHGSGDSTSSSSSVASGASDNGELYEMPVKDLTLQQLQMLKLNHVSEKDGNTKYDINEDHQPFPRLEVALQNLDEHTGFNIEVKYPLAYKDGKHEAEHYFERGEFVDQILKVVYKHAHNRRIIFSCFDPDSCAMLRVKQNKYPVSYLTKGEVTLWPAYADARTHTTRNTLHTAIAYDLIGVNVHTQNILGNEWLMAEAKEAGMIVIVWGDENNNPAVIQQLSEMGVDGVIYDRIEEFKEDKNSVFRLEYQAKRALLDQLRDTISN